MLQKVTFYHDIMRQVTFTQTFLEAIHHIQETSCAVFFPSENCLLVFTFPEKYIFQKIGTNHIVHDY